jgi:DNA-directed RNA polymerase subunit K/omega
MRFVVSTNTDRLIIGGEVVNPVFKRKFWLRRSWVGLSCSARLNYERTNLNSELCKQALAKVGNANVLVNLISKRVRQLNSGGSSGRPLIADPGTMGIADIALAEVVDDKLGWELLEPLNEGDAALKKKKKTA